ncbi:MAG: flavohemoglobin expression-modulating QEGLA motif protein [Pseudohongiellaceae bacterium]
MKKSGQLQYRERLRALSDRLIELQRPIRILDAIKWPGDVQAAFLRHDGKRLPRIPADHYRKQSLGFEPARLREEFRELRGDISRQLGRGDGLGRILRQTVDQYLMVIDLLDNRGTPEFGRLSRQLYGSARDHMRGDRKTLRQLGERLGEIFSMPGALHLARPYERDISAGTAVTVLQQQLENFFQPGDIRVMLSDGIVSDAAAGGDYIKINQDADFTDFDLKVLEVHEGWVHVGTTLNGRQQPWASWLSVGSPRVTACQEGLAVLMETLTLSSYPARALKVSDRVTAVDMAEEGADFVEVYRYFRERDMSEKAAYTITQRVFRGGMPEGGAAFTKDLSYLRGFVENVNFIRSAIQSGVPEILPMLFVGKLTLDDIPTLYEYYLEGTIAGPHYIPDMFRDLNGLYVWFGFASGISAINMARVQRHYARLFASLPKGSPLYEKVIDSVVNEDDGS